MEATVEICWGLDKSLDEGKGREEEAEKWKGGVSMA